MKFEGSIDELRSLAGCDQIEKLAIANEHREMLRAALDYYRRNAGLPALHQSDIAGQLISGNVSSLTPAQMPQYQQPQLPQYQQQPQYQLPAAPSYWPEPISAIATPVVTPAQMFQEYSGTSAMTVIQPNEPSLLAGAMTVMDGQPESRFMAFINSNQFTMGLAVLAAAVGLSAGWGAGVGQWALQKMQVPQSSEPALVAPPATEEPPAPVPAQ